MRTMLVAVAAMLCTGTALAQTATPASATVERPQPADAPPNATTRGRAQAAPARAQPQPYVNGGQAAPRGGAMVTARVAPTVRPNVSGFSAVLVAGDLKAARQGLPDEIPAAARKALTEMQAFLPFKSYQLLDVAWLLSNQVSNGSSLRLRGPNGQPYQLDIVVAPSGQLDVAVKLSEINAAPEQRLLLNTRFQMTVGESVVVGTSRLSGGNALILLLTAAPANANEQGRSGDERVVIPIPEGRTAPAPAPVKK